MATADAYLPPLVTELKADISGLKKGLKEARDEVKKYKDDLGGLKDGLKGVKKETDESGKAVSDFERLVRTKMKSGETAVVALRREYEELNKTITRLRDKAGGADSTDADHKALKEALGALKTLGDLGTDLGLKLGDGIGKGVGNAMSAAGPIVQLAIVAAIIGAAIVAAPFVGGILAAGITAGLGAGVVGLAAYILKDDKGIKKAWEKLTKTTSGVFERAVQPMKKPFIELLGWLNTEFKKLEPEFRKLFEAAAPLVKPLGEGLFGMLKNALPGITEAIKNSEPLFKSLGENLPKIGTALGEMFKAITQDPEALAEVFGDGITLAAGFIIVLGELLGWLTRAYSDIKKALKDIKDWFVGLPGEIKKSLGDPKTWLYGPGKAIIDGMIRGIKDRVLEGDGLWAVLRWATMGGITTVKNALESKSPSKVFERIGRDTVAGYTIGIQRSAPEAWAAQAGLVAPQGAGRYVAGPPALLANRAVATQTGGGALAIAAAPLTIELDGRVLYQGGIQYAQRGRMRNTTTGYGP